MGSIKITEKPDLLRMMTEEYFFFDEGVEVGDVL